MSWRENLREASFRGVVFQVDAHDTEVGRRTAIHEYPLRDLPWVEDLGRKARKYTVEAFVLGPNYMATRDDLLAACEQAGSGTLVHPYLGSKEVCCLECRLRESRQEGGWAKFSLVFLESGSNTYPDQDSETYQATEDVATASAAFSEAFTTSYTADLPDWASSAATVDLASALDYIRVALASVRTTLARVRGEIATAIGTVQSLLATVQAIPKDAEAVAQTLESALASLGLTADQAGVDAALEVSLWGSPSASLGAALPEIPLTTDTRRTQAANREALLALVHRLALAQGISAALTMEMESYEQARAVCDRLMTRLEDLLLEAGDAGDDLGFVALTMLRTEALPALTSRAATLPRLRMLTAPPGPAPAVVIAHDLYEDSERAQEIIGRNRIRHPLFPPSGQALEVLSA